MPVTSTIERLGEPPHLEPPTPDKVLYAVLALTRQVRVEMHDEEIVHAYIEALRTLFPHRLFVIRLLVPETGRLSLVYATGRLEESRRHSTEVTSEALERHGVAPAEATEQGLEIVETYTPVFADGGHGFDVPMTDGEKIVGMLGVEYPRGLAEPPDDRALIVQITLQIGSALRNARLLRESVYLRDYLTKLVDHANAPIIVIDRHREIRMVNRAFLALMGVSRQDLLGRDFLQMLPSSEPSSLLPAFINALRGEPTSNFEVKIPRAGGGFARLAVNTASILSPDGEVDSVIAIGRDITEVRELEEQIIQAEKLATLGQLAAGVVHELNNPLTSISVYGEYLLKKHDGKTEAGDVEKMRRIVQSAERILRFTRDLVVYARPSNEEPRALDVHEVLDQSIVFCEHVIAEAGAQVDKAYGESLPPVLGVKGQLQQVFINLVTNACHAMPEGAGRLRVETTLVEGRVSIRVRDNGAGIPPDHVDRIFEPFFSTKGEGKGTGLGLSIVRNIVQQHNGEIEVDSEVGRGTCFSIVLPCRPQR